MAYAKTSSGHLLAQLAAGSTVGALCWYSLLRDPFKRSPPQAEVLVSEADRLEESIRQNTTGQVWGLRTSPEPVQQPDPPHIKKEKTRDT